MKHLRFAPAMLTAKAGTRVTWVLGDRNDPHNVDSRSKALHVSSGSTLPRGTWSFTAPRAYPYRCDVHQWMQGTIVVTP